MIGFGGESPEALLATCVKYPAAVPKPAPPKITEGARRYFQIMSESDYTYGLKPFRVSRILRE